MAGLEPLVVFWKGSGVRMVVLLSFAVQVILLALADARRIRYLISLKTIIWSAYVLADTTAIYALGHMSLVSRSPEHHLMALWAPLLLVHLGGQDNITAYAIEDNQLWLRHLQNFGVQVVAAAYVLHVSTVLGSQTWLRSASIVIFVVGVLKYGERVVSLMGASSYASSGLSATSYKDFLSRHERPDATSVMVERVDVLDAPPRYLVELQSIAYTLLDVPKQMFEGPTRYVEISSAQRRLSGEDMLRVVRIQLSMMYDLLYTKAAVVHTLCGACIRVFSLPATIVALVLFHLHLHASGDKHGGYSRADVVATYVLLGGALVVETTSVVRAMCASWACALLVKAKWVRLAQFLHMIGGIVTWRTAILDIVGCQALPILGSMGQHNLFWLCAKTRKSATSRIARLMERDDLWDSWFYSRSTIITEGLIQAVVQLVSRSERDGEFDIRNSRGRTALRYNEELLRSVELDLDESILVWHIATRLCLTWFGDRDGDRVDRHKLGDVDQVVKALSNYMFFLLAVRPYMLPYPVSRQRYVQLCHDVITSPEDLLGSIQDQVSRAQSPDQIKFDYPVGSHLNKTLEKGCRLAEDLVRNGSTLHMIRDVWVEMLCYAAYRCNEKFHAKHLNNGGELMTMVALFMLYDSSGLINTSSAADTENV